MCTTWKIRIFRVKWIKLSLYLNCFIAIFIFFLLKIKICNELSINTYEQRTTIRIQAVNYYDLREMWQFSPLTDWTNDNVEKKKKLHKGWAVSDRMEGKNSKKNIALKVKCTSRRKKENMKKEKFDFFWDQRSNSLHHWDTPSSFPYFFNFPFPLPFFTFVDSLRCDPAHYNVILVAVRYWWCLKVEVIYWNREATEISLFCTWKWLL